MGDLPLDETTPKESLNLEADNMAELLKLYKPFMLQHLRASHLIPFLPILNPEEVKEIIRLSRKESDAKSTEYLLNLLIKRKDEDGIWRSFKTALEDADYQIILQNLKGKLAQENHVEHCRIIQLFYPALHRKIKPSELLPSLFAKNIINEIDRQEIVRQESNEGDILATMTLLERIKNHEGNWYNLFLEVLFETDGYLHLAKILDPDFVEKKRQQSKEHSLDYENTESMVPGKIVDEPDLLSGVKSVDSIRENIIKASGPAHQNNDLNAPNSPRSTLDDECSLLLSDLSLSSLASDNDNRSLSSSSSKSAKNRVVNAVPSSKSPMNQLMYAVQERVVEGAENNNDDEITQLKQLHSSSSSQGNVTNYYNDETTMEKQVFTAANGTTRSDECLASNTACDQKSDLYTKSIEPSLTSTVVNAGLNSTAVNAVFQSIDREFDVVRQLEPNILREDSYAQAENQRPENMAFNKETLELRIYQEELARPALAGKNTVIVAPTGSGKTHVAMKIIQDHFESTKGKKVAKVAFLVEQSALADQQAKQCEKYLQASVKLITGESQRTERLQQLSHWLDKRDILVVTAQILVNSLASGDVRIQDFTLMVFDECHHTASKHPYNQIMQKYMDLKFDVNLDKSSLPQVIGLTASVGVGKAKNIITAKEWVKKVMANIDADELSTVRDYRQELSKHVNIPEEEVVKVFGRRKDIFGKVLGKIMETVEKFMRSSEYAKLLPNAETLLKAPAERGVDQYTQWISGLWRATAKIDDQNARRFFVTCRTYLDIYNKSLIVYADARVKDALDLIKDELRKWDENTKDDETDKKLKTLYTKSKKLLELCLADPGHDNPKLEKLKEMIVKAYQDNEDMRGIVFVKTRDLVKAIETWMKETQGLKELRPVKFVGAQACNDKGGMTKVDQDNTLEFFREGQHKVIIATSVAEEGLDIRKCNLVIRYDHVTNEIAMVQSRGRGRAEDSKYVVLAEHGGRTAEKEELNLIRENLMNNAIIEVQDDVRSNPRNFKTGQDRLQREAKVERDLEAKTRGRRTMMEGEFEMRCFRCSCFICFSSDIHKIQNAHHAAICSDITDRIVTTKTNPQYANDEIKTGIGKINCMKCGYDLGNVTLYKNVQFPVLKISGFLIVDNMERRNVFKRWKQVPFHVQDLSAMDLERMAEYPQLVNE